MGKSSRKVMFIAAYIHMNGNHLACMHIYTAITITMHYGFLVCICMDGNLTIMHSDSYCHVYMYACQTVAIHTYIIGNNHYCKTHYSSLCINCQCNHMVATQLPFICI